MSSKNAVKTSEKSREGIKIGMAGFVFVMLAIATGFLIDHWTDVKDIKCDIDKISPDECTCASTYADFFVVGVQDNNRTSLIFGDSHQQIDLQNPQQYTSGGQVHVSKQGELWDLNAASGFGGNVITIYETTTWVQRDVISLPIACAAGNYDIAYHPEAGAENRGQVWVSCEPSNIWVIFDPASRVVLTTINLPGIYTPEYSLFEIVVGKDHAVASLQNSTSGGTGILLQLSTNTGEITASKSVGALPHLWYRGDCDSRLYVVSELDEVLYAIDYDTLVTEQTSVAVGQGIAVTTDSYERFVYVVDGSSVGGVDSIRGFETYDITLELPASPYTTPHNGTFDISIGRTGASAIVSYDESAYASKFSVSRITGDLSLSTEDFDVAGSGVGHKTTTLESICPCALCVFYSSGKPNSEILLGLASASETS